MQALAGLGWGAEDERSYVWEEDENASIGRKKKGEQKAFGVCDEWWQINLRNVAKSHTGSDAYAFDTRVAAYGGFSSVPEGSWKCDRGAFQMPMKNLIAALQVLVAFSALA